MTDDRLIRAIGRLETAVATLESRLCDPAPAAPGDDDAGHLPARFARLEERHDTLRQRTAAAVARLDTLLAAGGGA